MLNCMSSQQALFAAGAKLLVAQDPELSKLTRRVTAKTQNAKSEFPAAGTRVFIKFQITITGWACKSDALSCTVPVPEMKVQCTSTSNSQA